MSRQHLSYPDSGVRDKKTWCEKAGLTKEIHVSSAATTSEEIGNPIYPPARKTLAKHGISCEGKTTRQVCYLDYEQYDLIIGMNRENLEDMCCICLGGPDGKIHLLMNYSDRPGDVANPWYTQDFEATWCDVERGCWGLPEHMPLI